MEASLLLLFSLASSLFLPPLAAQIADGTSTDQTEVTALKAIQEVWRIKDWDQYADTDPCVGNGGLWPHLSCTECSKKVSSCHINSLNLAGQNINAEIPPKLFELKSLTHLDLSKNLLHGSVSSQINSLSKLEYLDLSINVLNGSVPTELSDLHNLTYLNFGSNNFTGSFPNLGNSLSSLQELRFDSCGLSGQFNNGLGSLPALQVLWAFDNPISGSLDQSAIQNLKNLTELKIYGTFLQGPIPAGFQELKKLETLIIGDLSDTSNSNPSIPDRQSNQPNSSLSFLSNMTNLKTLSLRNCSLKGPNFPDIQTLPNLAVLDLSFNSLSGTINSSFMAKFPALRQLYLGGGNKFSGDVIDLIPPKTKIVDLDVSFNPINGTLLQSVKLHINYLGSSINVQPSSNIDREILNSIKTNSSGNINGQFNSGNINGQFNSSQIIAIKCGGDVHNTNSKNISFFSSDTNSLGAAGLSVDPSNFWVVSNVASFPRNESTYSYTASTSSSISETDPIFIPLYQSARRSQSSLSYYIVGLPNADNYTVELHFAEIVIGDPATSWRGLGKRFFNILVQDHVETTDFNIMDQAGGANRACNQTYHNVKVINGYIHIQLLWNGRGTCCIPEEGTYGPLISAIRIYQGDTAPVIPTDSSSTSIRKISKKAGVVVGILSLGIASVMITSSVLFLWWEWIQIAQEMKY